MSKHARCLTEAQHLGGGDEQRQHGVIKAPCD